MTLCLAPGRPRLQWEGSARLPAEDQFHRVQPQEFEHPEDIAGLWEDMLCTECHTGMGADL